MVNAESFQPPVRSVRLSDQVAAQLQALVTDNALKPGDKLPAERELCELLGVSRTVVREGVRSLVAKGLLEVRPGGGTMVRAPNTALVSELMSVMMRTGNDRVDFTHVQEVRRLLEVETARLAAKCRNESDLQRMEACLQAMREHENEAQLWAEADVAFHASIAVATHNPLYPTLLASIADLLIEVRLTGISLAETPTRAYGFHLAIFNAIKAQDRAAASKAMQNHLRESEDTFKKARISKALRSSKGDGR